MIRNLLSVARQDLQQVYPILQSFCRDKSVKNSALWVTINETAKKAMSETKRWQDCLTMNSIVDSLKYRANSGDINDWLLNADVGFDPADFKKDQDREKDRNLNNSIKRQTLQQLQLYNQNRNDSSGNNRDTRPSNRNSTQRRRKRGISLSQALKTAQEYLNAKHPNTMWDKDFCAFYNCPNVECKPKGSSTCSKNHGCPVCEGAKHPIYECPVVLALRNN